MKIFAFVKTKNTLPNFDKKIIVEAANKHWKKGE